MCGRYSQTLPPDAVRRWFDYRGQPNFAPRYNIAPTQEVPILRSTQAGHELVIARWGLVPSWAKEIGGKPLINARSEGVEERPAFRDAFRARRCLVPADGFFEWQQDAAKTPYRICRADRGLFAMAGLWEHWQDRASGQRVVSFAIMTTNANTTLDFIHDRMPVILADADREAWLAPGATAGELKALLKPAPDNALIAYAISARVNRVANDDAQVLEPAEAAAPKGQMTLF